MFKKILKGALAIYLVTLLAILGVVLMINIIFYSLQ